MKCSSGKCCKFCTFKKRKLQEKHTKKASNLRLKDIIDQYGNTVLLLGNGFNKAFYGSATTVVSWAKLVADLWNVSHPSLQITEDYVNRKHISMTETAQMSERQFEDIRKLVVEIFSKNVSQNEDAVKFVQYLESCNIPIITTNYDNYIGQGLNLSQFCSYRERNDMFRRFEWGRYYAKEEIPKEEILNKFAIWNAHGSIDTYNSICFTLTDYLECAEYADKLLENIYSPFYIPSNNHEPCYKYTWLNLIFEKNLCIAGLLLEENEIFIRLLLMLRYSFMKNHYGNIDKYKGWFLYVNDNEMSDSKRFFLRSVQIEPIKCKNYESIYKSF